VTRGATWAAGLAAAVGAALRLTNLDHQSLWSDEIGTLVTAARPLLKTIGAIAISDLHPPLYYVLAHFWQLIGYSDAFVRLLPALCGLGVIVAVYWLGRRDFDETVGAASALLLAVWPLHVYLSGEYRPYASASLLAVLSFCELSADWRATPRARIGWIAATIAGLYTDYLFAFVVLAQLPIFRRRAEGRSWRSFAATAAAFVPGALLLAFQLGRRNFLVKTLIGAGLPLTAWREAWSFGGPPRQVTTLIPPLDAVWRGNARAFELAALLLLTPAIWLLARGVREAWRSAMGRATIAWAFLPPLALLALSPWAPAFEAKQLILTLPAVALLLALGAARPRLSVGTAAALAWLAALMSLAIWQHRTDPRFFRDDWRGLARVLAADVREGDAVIGATFELRYYSLLNPLPEIPMLVIHPRELFEGRRQQTREETAAHLAQATAGCSRVWFEPSPVKGLPVVDDVDAWLRANLYDITPDAYRARRPEMRLYARDRARLAEAMAQLAPSRLDFRAGPVNERLLRGVWLPTDEGWRWGGASASAWVARPPDANAAGARLFVKPDLYPQDEVTVRLLAEGREIAAATVRRADQIWLQGPLPPEARNLPAVELAIRADRTIWPDQRDELPPERRRIALVGELATFPALP
jgi:hypothetical protein